ncbi:MAG: hypothetical protein AB7F96_15670 [Beijerinckiaceae bacterium]
MKRGHRAAHRVIWIVLALLIAAGFAMALVKRKPQKKASLAPLHEIARLEYRP